MSKLHYWTKSLILIGIILIFVTIGFWLTDWDVSFSEQFYCRASKEWCTLESHPIWTWMYQYIPAMAVGLGGFFLLLISFSFWNSTTKIFRKYGIIFILTMIIGPGIIVNAVLKDHWGRPRPREITHFGGSKEFMHPWQYSKQNGESFPSGHTSMGFMFGIPFLFFRRNNKVVAYTVLVGGVLVGLLMGYARIKAGGHFLSDTIWAGGIVWMTAIALSWIFKLDDPLEDYKDMDPVEKVASKWLRMGLPSLAIFILLATPYISNKEHQLSENTIKQIVIEGDVDLKIVPADSTNLSSEVFAFGLPSSKIIRKYTVSNDTLYLVTEKHGFYTKVQNQSTLQLPLNEIEGIQVIGAHTDVSLSIPDWMHVKKPISKKVQDFRDVLSKKDSITLQLSDDAAVEIY